MVAEDLVADTALTTAEVETKPAPAPVHVEPTPEEPSPTPEPEAPARRQRWRGWLRPVWIILEIATSVTVALLFPYWARDIDVDPMNRIGQVSGLAALQFRFAVIAGVIVIVLVVAHRLLSPYWRDVVVRIGCAAVAGLATGLVAGGVAVALRDTPYPLWAGGGDYGWILEWTERLIRGEDFPDHYPPLPFHIIAYWAESNDQSAMYALKDLQIFGTALFGPAAYLAWRMTLRPLWALGIGVVAMLPFIEAVKPYPQFTLVVLVPLLVAFLRQVRRADRLHPLFALLFGALFGAGMGLLFLLYSGWFVWCAAGSVVAFLLVVPWRRGWRQALLLAGSAALIFGRISWQHMQGLLAPTGGTRDNFFYFDTNTEPTYFAMWRNDRPGTEALNWPPSGELGGVGVFTLLLAAGIGLALWFGWRRTTVIALGCFAASAWFMRMWLASEQWETQTVRLYPRTTALLLYCSLLLAGFAVLYGVQSLRRTIAHRLAAPASGPPRGAAPAGLLLIPLLLVFASAGSATSSRLMPDTERRDALGYMSWVAHMRRLPDGTCSRFGLVYGCKPLPVSGVKLPKEKLPNPIPMATPRRATPR